MKGLRKHLSFIYFIIALLGFAVMQKWLRLETDLAVAIVWSLNAGLGYVVGANVGAKFSPFYGQADHNNTPYPFTSKQTEQEESFNKGEEV